MAIKDPQRFVNQVVGAQGMYTTAQINDYLRGILVSEIATVLGQTMQTQSLLNLAALQADLGAAIQAKAGDDFEALGIALKKAYVISIQPGEETAKAIATRSAMGAVGANYMQYQAGQAMRDAAQNVFSNSRQQARTINRLEEEAAIVHVLNGQGGTNLKAINVAAFLAGAGMDAVVPPIADGKADRKDYTGTLITVYNGAEETMPETVTRLKRLFKDKGAEVVFADDPEQGADIVVIVGEKTKA